MKISYGKNVYDHQEINAVIKQLKKTTQMGESVQKFETHISKFFKKKYGVMVNSGSSAITLAMRTLNIKDGDEIITPCLNFGTAVSSILLARAKPIFVDINLETLQINSDLIEKKISNKTKALLLPNLIGNIPNLKKIYNLSQKYKLKIIEDSADTLGATINGKPTGTFSDISITSFYGSHIISCAGNGGMFMTNDKSIYQKAKLLRSWGRMSTLIKDSENIENRLKIKLSNFDYDKKFVFSEIGYNFEPSEIGASFGLVQIKKFNSFSKKRIKNFQAHKSFFLKYKKYFIVPEILKGVKTNFLAYPIIIRENKKFKKKQLQIFLEKCQIQTRPIFSGNILRHPAFKNLISKKNKLNNFPNSDYIMKNGLLIGCHQGLKSENIKFIHDKIKQFLNN